MNGSNYKEPTRLPEQEFLESFKNVPRVAVNLIVNDINNKVLLTRRSIPPAIGSWHFPGSFVLKNEQIKDALIRVAKDELGIELNQSNNLNLLGAFDDLDGDPRGHVIDLAYGLIIEDTSIIKPTKETLEFSFFEKGKLPQEIGFNHRETLNKLGY